MTGPDGRQAKSGRAARTARRRAARIRTENELRDLVFVEVPDTTASAIARTAADLSIAFAVGAGAAWALLLIAAIVGDEALGSLSRERELELDAFLRATIPPLFVLAAVISLAISLLAAADAAAALRLLERHTAAKPNELPSAAHRARLATPPARFVRRSVLAVAVIAMAVGGFLLCFALLDEEGRIPEVWTVVAVSVVVVLAWLVARPSLQRLEERQGGRSFALELTWKRSLGAADLAEWRRREASDAVEPPAGLLPSAKNRSARPLLIAVCALGVALVLWFVSVWLRQPCKRCDERYFDEPVERFIDGLSLWGGIAIALIVALIAVLAVVLLVQTRRAERAAVRWVADGTPRRVPDEVAEQLLLGQRAGLWASRVVMAALVPPAVFLVAAALVDPELGIPGVATSIALAILVAATAVATAVGAADLTRAARERNALRAALSPGDPDLASIAAHAAEARLQRAKLDRRAQRGR
ncbi:hypothetical protein SAMN05428970_1150 [Agromyces sp. CF514]|uniref:hypothetical protein n=1 Tax=Agromyces sp. CF514 TaxID=1881031 RepID=UPI0008E038D3|nr:hypothetical protein [Agromyces sp. CF514]SFR71260.1 hypothetical protein SAMN05428970_1150 [Agromyces sp. CF514]